MNNSFQPNSKIEEFQSGIQVRSDIINNPNLRSGAQCTSNGLCVQFIHDRCQNLTCPYLHDQSKIRVCEHYLRGSCKQGDDCHFSHNLYNYTICKYLIQKGKCNKEGCKYKHVLTPCRDYDKGFCIKGKLCSFSHIPKKLCLNYTYGFCPLGPQCQDSHPKFFNNLDERFIKSVDFLLNQINQDPKEQKIIRCGNKLQKCEEIGHKTPDCILTKEIPLNTLFYCFRCKNKHELDQCKLNEQN